MDGLALAAADMGVKAEKGDNRIAVLEQVLNDVSRGGKQLVASPQSPRHLGGAAASSGLDRVGGIDVFDVRGAKFRDEPLRISIDQPLLVDPADDLDVLLRHRPRSISRQ